MKTFLASGALMLAALVLPTPAEAAGQRGGSFQNSGGSHFNSNYKTGSHNGSQYKSSSHYGSQYKSSSHYGSQFKSGSHYGSGRYSNYHSQYGTRFSKGYYYSGRNHSHWTYRCFWSQYGCDCYWCPSTCCWYYFCEPRDCYLPVNCITAAPPAPVNVAAAAAASSSAVVAPTVVTNIIGGMPSSPVQGPGPGPSAELPPLAPPGGPSVTNSSVGSVGTIQPIVPGSPLLPR